MGNVPLTFKKNTLLMQLILIISMLSLSLSPSLSFSLWNQVGRNFAQGFIIRF